MHDTNGPRRRKTPTRAVVGLGALAWTKGRGLIDFFSRRDEDEELRDFQAQQSVDWRSLRLSRQSALGPQA